MSPIPVTFDSQNPTWDWVLSKENDGIVHSSVNDKEWSVELEASQFKPDEVDIQVLHGILIISLKHVAREDSFGTVERSITRSYHLPSTIDQSTLKSNLSPRGILKITAQKK